MRPAFSHFQGSQVRNQQRPLHEHAWRVPSIYAACAIAAGLALPRLETRFVPHLMSDISVSAATAMYSSIASGMIALTAIVFSVTFVMVQFSATAYSPRLVLWLARDPLLSHALGVFMATFLYALAALAWVDRGGGRVPFISSMTVLGLLLVSIAFFVALVHRIARLQVNRLLAFTGERGREVIDALYPALDSATTAPTCDRLDVAKKTPSQICSYRGRPLAVQAIHIDALRYMAEQSGGVMEVLSAVGDTLLDSTPLVHFYDSRIFIDEDVLRGAFQLGEERSFDQDPKYALRLLVDIAVKALSPAINDPTTAVQALDQIADLLLRLSRRRVEIGTYRDPQGQLRLVIPFPTWDDFLCLAFDEICRYGATSVQVMRRMNALISDLESAVPLERREGLKRWKLNLAASIKKHFDDPDDQQRASTADRQGLGISRRQSVA
jgi:uncharacterized membrane protein